MPEVESGAKPEVKRRHICGQEGIGRDEDGNCKECGVPIDEYGFETVNEEADQAVKNTLRGEEEIPDSPQKLLRKIKHPDLRALVEEHYEKRGKL